MEPTRATTLRPALGDLMREVVGELAFMITDEPVGGPDAGAVWLTAEIRYGGPASGVLRCWTTRALATRLAANILGVDTDEGRAMAQAEDALRELLNVLAGQLVTAWHGSVAVFNLTIPVVQESSSAPPVVVRGSESCQFCIEGEPIVCVHTRGG